ncbi:carboxypeptidase-like regulatory domain-containing protein [Candidatus Synechococcus calcipolaris G9]|uniref:Carboxypeptidase-like regulatory domain-containing protein n=1 Tax=Candidatus Synechococcus calcipolaris G9 TaxID=1497997 RepID=A0ABT6EUB7_9SYNE|nr:carboxypeptidase-like regulatory domain-containing protein [Candidatus Synechococcus calcipolaris]MDG2989474.1 carboxypeptidase-like regulatory domain-containing protein [Candidatus Synechococcus calcipolaris G9]
MTMNPRSVAFPCSSNALSQGVTALGLMLLTFGLPLVWSGRALGHAVVLNYQPIQEIEIQASYDSGEPMAGGQVLIYAPDTPTQPIMQGLTDDQGRFRFQPDGDRPGYWQVQVRQAGHGGRLNILVESPQSDPTSELAPELTIERSQVEQMGQPGTYTPLQLGIMVGAVFWGSFGTACFFWSKKQSSVPN